MECVVAMLSDAELVQTIHNSFVRWNLLAQRLNDIHVQNDPLQYNEIISTLNYVSDLIKTCQQMREKNKMNELCKMFTNLSLE